jgi:hypothetical protein
MIVQVRGNYVKINNIQQYGSNVPTNLAFFIQARRMGETGDSKIYPFKTAGFTPLFSMARYLQILVQNVNCK